MAKQQPPRFGRSAVVLGVVLTLLGAVTAFVLLRMGGDPGAPTATPSPSAGATASSLATSIPTQEVTFSFVALGDYGSRDAEEDAIAGSIRRLALEVELDAFVTTGDNVYPESAPGYLTQAWDEPYGWLDRTRIDVYASLGNHDISYDGGEAVMERLRMPDRWYARQIADVELFVLDSNAVGDPSQIRWLAETLRDSDAPWQVLAFHHPPYSCSLHGNSQAVIDGWLDLFDEHGVDLVLNGHDHNYQRFEPEDGTTFVVTGGGGYRLYEIGECAGGTPDLVETNDDVHHFLHVQGDAGRLDVRVLTADGTEIDEFKLTR